jgi:hypothetical protein
LSVALRTRRRENRNKGHYIGMDTLLMLLVDNPLHTVNVFLVLKKKEINVFLLYPCLL